MVEHKKRMEPRVAAAILVIQPDIRDGIAHAEMFDDEKIWRGLTPASQASLRAQGISVDAMIAGTVEAQIDDGKVLVDAQGVIELASKFAAPTASAFSRN